jgi:transcriptional regulator with XRE-family HTH domain
MMSLGDRIRSQLARLGLSQAELARRVGLTQPTINGLITGKSASSVHLHRIARELKTTSAYLTGETDNPESDHPDEALTSRDREDLELLNRLSERDRALVRQLIRSLADHNEDIPSTPAPTPATLHSPVRKFAGGRG